MRMTALLLSLVLGVSAPAVAQEWAEYLNTEDGFRVNFPGPPTRGEITWTSQLGYMLPGSVYSVERGGEHYALTVIDYTSLEQQGIERSETCPPGNAQCRADAGPVIGHGYWKQDERGAILYATFTILQRDATLTSLAWEWQDRVEGHSIHLTNNVDGSRTFAHVAMHQNKLYILESTVPQGYPEPGLFQQSLGWVDAEGNSIRYETVYSNAYHGMGEYPLPPIVGRNPADAAGEGGSPTRSGR